MMNIKKRCTYIEKREQIIKFVFEKNNYFKYVQVPAIQIFTTIKNTVLITHMTWHFSHADIEESMVQRTEETVRDSQLPYLNKVNIQNLSDLG